MRGEVGINAKSPVAQALWSGLVWSGLGVGAEMPGGLDIDFSPGKMRRMEFEEQGRGGDVLHCHLHCSWPLFTLDQSQSIGT